MSKYDLPALADELRVQFPDVQVFLDDADVPAWVHARVKHGSIHVWQFGNAYPRVDASQLQPRWFPVLRAVMAWCEDAGLAHPAGLREEKTG